MDPGKAQAIVDKLAEKLSNIIEKNNDSLSEAYWTERISEKINSFKEFQQSIKAYTKSKDKKEFSFKSVLKKTDKIKYFHYEHIPFYMEGTDIVVDDKEFIELEKKKQTYTARDETLGIEFKIITDLKDDPGLNVSFFRTGCLSVRSQWKEFEVYQRGYCPCCNQPEFIQNNFMTHCKEGQFLSDYCRTIRVYAHSKLNIGCFCGICIYEDPNIKGTIQSNMCELIKYFHGKKHKIKSAPDVLNYNSLLYINYNNGCLTKRVMCTLQNFELKFFVDINVLDPIQKKYHRRNCYFYPYVIILYQDSGLTSGCT